MQIILENQTSQRTAKFIIADFYEMDFMKGIVILSKSRWGVLYLGKSASIGREIKVELDNQRFCCNLPFNYLYYVLALVRGRLHLFVTISYNFFHKMYIINVVWAVNSVLNLRFTFTQSNSVRALLEIFQICFHFLLDLFSQSAINDNISFTDYTSGIRLPECSKLAINWKIDNDVTIFRHDVIIKFF